MGLLKKKGSGKGSNRSLQGEKKDSSVGGTPKSWKKSRKRAGSSPGKEEKDLLSKPLTEVLPQLTDNLANHDKDGSDKLSLSLRVLFKFSENKENRTSMIEEDDGRLVTTLFDFLVEAEQNSSDKLSLVLLILNNLSIPPENKRFIALDKDGVRILCRLMCKDPSIQLIAIVLVNLTFSDIKTRKELTDPNSDIELIEALAYAIKICTQSKKASNIRKPQDIYDECKDPTPKRLLEYLDMSQLNGDFPKMDEGGNNFNPDNLLLKDTAKWCLCALKNLSRTDVDSTTINVFIETGILSLIKSFSSVKFPEDDSQKGADLVLKNHPCNWTLNSLQDTSLHIFMNFAAIISSHKYLTGENLENILINLTDFSSKPSDTLTLDQKKVTNYQCVKARCALGLLIASDGYYGQPISISKKHSLGDTRLLVGGSEAPILTEIFGDTLHKRGKNGPGGYSISTFNVNTVLLCIRCLLTNYLNIKRLHVICGLEINTMLCKTLSIYVLKEDSIIEKEGAEHACFSLYLMSNCGFNGAFLPSSFTKELVGKILFGFLSLNNISAASQHAATQLLMRLEYLKFDGDFSTGDEPLHPSDYFFDDDTFAKLSLIEAISYKPGVKPMHEIFGRPLLSKFVRKSLNEDDNEWESSGKIVAYPSALDAVRDLSFGSDGFSSSDDLVDEIQIANNIVEAANGEETQYCGYDWLWEDGNSDYFEEIEKEYTPEKLSALKGIVTGSLSVESEPYNPFHLGCGKTSLVDY
eukprot:CAMPEP_0184857928 /NCGR_PEP_ID=MMETSP0580-20130426/3076_1 /TAXON_ID=1118495 /ORGANISM="Dactyliosolen fragilissimus" /LENGTH=750 /DNA_ID=CAMNT_0027353811 /DNA_START=59 /DNA_END=2311 /DNA_ORIENTATION=+